MDNKIIKRIFNGLGIFLVSILALVILLYFLIQQECIQTWIVQKATTTLSEKTGTNISVGKVRIKFFKTLSLSDVYVEDMHGDTLAYIHQLDSRLAYINPFSMKFHFNSLSLDGVRANIYRTENDSTFNYQFLIDALKGQPKPLENSTKEKKKTANAVDLRIKDIHLSDINVIFDDKMGGQGHLVRLGSLDISVQDIDLNEKIIDVNTIKINSPKYTLQTYLHKDDDTTANDPFRVDIGWRMEVKNLELNNGGFGIHDHTKTRTFSKDGFEFSWFDVDSIYLTARDFRWDSILAVDIDGLAARSIANDVNLTQLKGKAQMHDSYIDAQSLLVTYNKSKVEGDARLTFRDFGVFGEFIDSVHIKADLKAIQSNGHDVGVWAKVAQQYVPEAFISGKFNGTVADFEVEDLVIRANGNTEIISSGKMKGIPDPDKMYIDAQIHHLRTKSSEVKALVPYLNLPKELDLIGNIRASGTFIGKIKDFNTNLDLTTDVGHLHADAHLRFPSNSPLQYTGKIYSKGLNLQKVAKVEQLGNIAFDLKIDGHGTDLDNIHTTVNGTVRDFDFNYYKYADIVLNGRIENRKFEGQASLEDDCANLDFKGLVDFNDPEKPIYNFYANVVNADLQQLNLISKKVIVSIEGDFKFEGKDINDLTGQANLSNINVMDNEFNVDFSDLLICLDKHGEYKKYTVESEDINGFIQGDFDPIKLPASLQFYLSQHTTLLKAPGIEKLDHLMTPQDVEMNIKVSKDIGIASLIDPKIKSFSDISLVGTYNSDASKINLSLQFDSLQYDNLKFNQFNTNVFDRNDSLIVSAKLNSLNIGKTIINNISLGSTTNLTGFYSRLRVENDTNKNNLELVTVANFNNDTINIRFPRSKFKINNKIWTINPNNSIFIVDSIFKLNNFTLEAGDQSIRIANRQNLSDAFVQIKNLDLADLAQVVDTTGILKNGFLDANIRLKNALKSPEIDGDITLRDINVYDEEIDVINLNANLSDIEKSLNIDGFINDNDYKLQLSGKYSLEKNAVSPINLDVVFERLSLKFLSFPIILGNEISNMNAFTKGNIKVGGSFKDIQLDGKATIIDTATVKVNFLGTTLKFAHEDIVLKPRSIEFYKGGLFDKSITLMDEFGNKASMTAKLEHRNFKDFAVQTTIISDKFNFLNTTYKDNKDFFGKVYAAGSVDISGPLDKIEMNINAKTLPNTEFNIVVAGSTGDQLYEYVKFTDRSAPQEIKIENTETKTPSSLTLDMNINATPDASLKLYLDYAKNDVIRARGNGELQLRINPNGMEMFGEYVATSGDYLFSQQDIINKRFAIKNGSTINWSGNIMDAAMNVDAIYSSRVNMNDIVDSTSNLRNRRFPVDVVLNIGGTLASTDINFSLAPPAGQSNTPDELMAVLERVNNDPAQRNTQAFGLILFNRFLNLQNTNNTQAGNIGIDMAVTTLSEFFNAKISEYVNDALSMLLPGTEVAINQGTDNTGIRVTRKLSNDRLIINLGGDVQYGNRDNLQLQENNTGFVGDVEIEYLVTEDGRIRAKVYSQYDNTIIRLENESYLRSGIGITYQKEVDRFIDLLKFDGNRKRRKLKKALEEKDSQKDSIPEDEIPLNNSVIIK